MTITVLPGEVALGVGCALIALNFLHDILRRKVLGQERILAVMQAQSMIRGCRDVCFPDNSRWFDIDNPDDSYAATEVMVAAKYLTMRKLLIWHPSRLWLVQLCEREK